MADREPQGPTGLAAHRLLSQDVLGQALEADEAAEGPAVGTVAIAERAGAEVGLWEIGPGTDRDTEVDEWFLVLSGAGTLRFADGSQLDLHPGVLVSLMAGDRTTWVITETLRKLYVALG